MKGLQSGESRKKKGYLTCYVKSAKLFGEKERDREIKTDNQQRQRRDRQRQRRNDGDRLEKIDRKTDI